MNSRFLQKLISSITTATAKFDGDMSGLADEELVNLYTANGDERAFEEIINRYMDKIYGFALRTTRNPSDAEEVFQDVFLTLSKKLHTFRGESKFSSWLYRVSMNTSYMYLRSHKKHDNNLSLDSYAPYDENGTLMGKIQNKDWSSRPDIAIFSKEATEIIENAINKLPESYRAVFHLRDIEGLTNEEVAHALDITIPAVKSRLHRGRLFLRDRLSDYFYEWRK